MRMSPSRENERKASSVVPRLHSEKVQYMGIMFYICSAALPDCDSSDAAVEYLSNSIGSGVLGAYVSPHR